MEDVQDAPSGPSLGNEDFDFREVVDLATPIPCLQPTSEDRVRSWVGLKKEDVGQRMS